MLLVELNVNIFLFVGFVRAKISQYRKNQNDQEHLHGRCRARPWDGGNWIKTDSHELTRSGSQTVN